MIEVSCHCGELKLQVPTAPEEVVSCNCSLCSKVSWLGAYYNPADVNLISPREMIDTYIWGDRTIQICRCKNCGFTTHWESIDPQQTERMGINARMMKGIDLDSIPLRKFDGASF